MIPGLLVVLLLGVVLACIQAAVETEPPVVPSVLLALDEGLVWRRYEPRAIEPPVLIGQPRVAYQLPDKRMSAQVAA